MKFSLNIEGSASQLAMILASLPDGVSVGAAPIAAPAPAPSAIPPMPLNGGGDDDEAGDIAAIGNLDNTGLPWDARIHSEKPTLTAKGKWRAKRGLTDAAFVAAVEAELRAGVVAPLPVPLAMPAPVAMASPVPAATIAPSPVMPMPAPVPIPMPAPQPMPAPIPAPVQEPIAAPSGSLDFAQFMQHLSGQMTKRDAAGAPLVHADYLAGITNEIAGAFQQPLSSITDIATNPQMITFAMQAMQRDNRW